MTQKKVTIISWIIIILLLIFFAVLERVNDNKSEEPVDNGLTQFEDADSVMRVEYAEPF
jgi:hypothetical protein